jgi:hypothetical protein
MALRTRIARLASLLAPLALSLVACGPLPKGETTGLKAASLAVSLENTVGCDAECKQLRQEFRYLVYVGKQVYAYWDEKKAETGTDFDALAAELEQSITSSTTYTDYYLILRRWAAAFHDGHVGALSKESDPDLEIYTASVRLEMLSPGTDHEKVVVTQSGGSTFKRGDEVLEVNGVPIAQAVTEAEKITSASTRRHRRAIATRELLDALGAERGARNLTLLVRTEGQEPRKANVFRSIELVPRPSRAAVEAEKTGQGNIESRNFPGGLG